MKLFLCSETIDEDLKPKFEEFIGKSCQGLRTAFIPTAANVYEDKTWVDERIEHLKNDLNLELDVIDISEVKGDELMQRLKSAELIWMNGGWAGYLVQQIRKSGLDKHLKELLESGIIYVGSSAGSVVMAQNLESAEWFLGDPEPGASQIPGLGYLDFQIYPHYRDELLDQIKQHKPDGETYYLLKDGQAIGYEDGEINLFGEGIVVLN